MTIRNSILKQVVVKDKTENNYVQNRNSTNINYKGKQELLISIVIPLYNEGNSIKEVIKRIPNHLKTEIIVIDDGSTDNSVRIVNEIKNEYIKLIRHKINKGYGAAILTGFSHARGNIVITMDSDGQHTPEEIPNLIEPIINNRADVVVGSRYLGKLFFKVPIYTRIGEHIINLFLWLLYRQRIGNNQNGFRAFKREVIEKLKVMNHTGMAFTTEILFKCASNSYKLYEIPMTANAREYGTSYVRVFKVFKSIFSCIFFYSFKKYNLDINRLFLKRFIDKIYNKIKHTKLFS